MRPVRVSSRTIQGICVELSSPEPLKETLPEVETTVSTNAVSSKVKPSIMMVAIAGCAEIKHAKAIAGTDNLNFIAYWRRGLAGIPQMAPPGRRQ